MYQNFENLFFETVVFYDFITSMGSNPKLYICVWSYPETFLLSIIMRNKDKQFYHRTHAYSKNVKLLTDT